MKQFVARSRPTLAGGSKPPRLYPLDLSVRYKILDGRSGTGSGRTVQIGSRNLVFSTDQVLEVNRKIRFTLDWPAALPDGVALRLWALGTIEAVDSTVVSVAFSGAEFRTCGATPMAESREALSPQC